MIPARRATLRSWWWRIERITLPWRWRILGWRGRLYLAYLALRGSRREISASASRSLSSYHDGMEPAGGLLAFVKTILEIREKRTGLKPPPLPNFYEKFGVREPDLTKSHGYRVKEIAVAIARAMHLPESEVETIGNAALLHDIGKIGVPTHILMKPGPLISVEWNVMRRHPIVGERILKPMEGLSEVATIVRHHHENYDGTGYPDRLKGGDIPLGSRIIMVVNAFDVMTTDAPYRQAGQKNGALRELREHAGGQFDPEVVRVFESVIDRV
jgi:putative nucleotidyltransferase with HDIG domain